MLRQAGWVILGVVAGFVAGGIGPRVEQAALQEQLTAQQQQLAEARQARNPTSSPRLPVPGMQGMFQGNAPDPASRSSGSADPEPSAPAAWDDTGVPPPPAGDTGQGPQDILTEYNLAVDAQRARAAQSRVALQEQADLSDEEMEAFDLLVEDMNLALADYGEDLMALALSGEEPEAEEMLGLTHEVTGILYDTQAQINDLVGPDAVDAVDPSTRQAWNHIDLEVFRGVVEEMEP